MRSVSPVISLSIWICVCTSPSVEGDTPDCGRIPAQYAQKEFGSTLFALATPCARTFTAKDQLFTAGLSQTLLEKCDLPKGDEPRRKLLTFLTSSTWVAVIGGKYKTENLGTTLGDQMASTTAYVSGASVAKALACEDRLAAKLAHGVVDYLDRTSSPNSGSDRFVKGCAKYYSGQYAEKQCQCVADVARAVFPEIHQKTYEPQLIKKTIEGNPFVGMQIAFQCGIGDY